MSGEPRPRRTVEEQPGIEKNVYSLTGLEAADAAGHRFKR